MFKSGFVSLVGRPNVGKSTLINHIIGEKVAIVSAKPQTTRSCLKGIYHTEDTQMIFVDTPGIHKPHHMLGQHIVDQALYILGEVDWHLFVVDATCPPGKGDEFIAKALGNKQKKTFLVLNKIDKIPKEKRDEHLEAYKALGDFHSVLSVSAKHSLGLEDLIAQLKAVLPEGVPMYPEDEYTTQSVRVMVAELIREQIFRQTGDELPHSTSVYIEDYKERSEKLTFIQAVIVVEKQSQKGMMIGKQGKKLGAIGAEARKSIGYFLGTEIYLKLFVKVMPHWRNKRRKLEELGYSEAYQE